MWRRIGLSGLATIWKRRGRKYYPLHRRCPRSSLLPRHRIHQHSILIALLKLPPSYPSLYIIAHLVNSRTTVKTINRRRMIITSYSGFRPLCADSMTAGPSEQNELARNWHRMASAFQSRRLTTHTRLTEIRMIADFAMPSLKSNLRCVRHQWNPSFKRLGTTLRSRKS